MSAAATTTKGEVEGLEEAGLLVFRGIPYAAPPTGKLRWQPPQPHPGWSDVLDTSTFGNQAPQNPSPLDALLGTPDVPPTRGEDCLFLNIWTPATDDARRPVMFWIHGGGFTIGAGSDEIYDGQYLASEGDVVVVTINYRMGALGFMNLNEVTDGKIPATGNEGLLDQIAALEWVRDNIAAFGGDPANVTIFGESAGGMSVGSLLAMPTARGLFHKAIPQSGACHTALSKSEAIRVTESVLEILGTDDPDALMEMPEATLTEVQTQLQAVAEARDLPAMPFQPVIDGEVLPAMPIELVKKGSATGVAVMAGWTAEEWKLFGGMDPEFQKASEESLSAAATEIFGDRAQEVIGLYRSWLADRGKETSPVEVTAAITTDQIFRMPALALLAAQHPHDERTYCYLFDWNSPLMGGALGACHAVELGFVFGTHDKGGAKQFFGEGPEAEALSALTRAAWVRFARTGNPSGDSSPKWPVYEPSNRSTMILSNSPRTENAPAEETRIAWDMAKENKIGTL